MGIEKETMRKNSRKKSKAQTNSTGESETENTESTIQQVLISRFLVDTVSCVDVQVNAS